MHAPNVTLVFQSEAIDDTVGCRGRESEIDEHRRGAFAPKRLVEANDAALARHEFVPGRSRIRLKIGSSSGFLNSCAMIVPMIPA